MDKFLIATNPNRQANDEIFIVHCLHPIFLMRVIALEEAFETFRSDPSTAFCEILVSEELAEKWILVPIVPGSEITGDMIGDNDIYRIACRAARWWRAYRTNNPNGHAVDPKAHRGPIEGGKDPGLQGNKA